MISRNTPGCRCCDDKDPADILVVQHTDRIGSTWYLYLSRVHEETGQIIWTVVLKTSGSDNFHQHYGLAINHRNQILATNGEYYDRHGNYLDTLGPLKYVIANFENKQIEPSNIKLIDIEFDSLGRPYLYDRSQRYDSFSSQDNLFQQANIFRQSGNLGADTELFYHFDGHLPYTNDFYDYYSISPNSAALFSGCDSIALVNPQIPSEGLYTFGSLTKVSRINDDFLIAGNTRTREWVFKHFSKREPNQATTIEQTSSEIILPPSGTGEYYIIPNGDLIDTIVGGNNGDIIYLYHPSNNIFDLSVQPIILGIVNVGPYPNNTIASNYNRSDCSIRPGGWISLKRVGTIWNAQTYPHSAGSTSETGFAKTFQSNTNTIINQQCLYGKADSSGNPVCIVRHPDGLSSNTRQHIVKYSRGLGDLGLGGALLEISEGPAGPSQPLSAIRLAIGRLNDICFAQSSRLYLTNSSGSYQWDKQYKQQQVGPSSLQFNPCPLAIDKDSGDVFTGEASDSDTDFKNLSRRKRADGEPIWRSVVPGNILAIAHVAKTDYRDVYKFSDSVKVTDAASATI